MMKKVVFDLTLKVVGSLLPGETPDEAVERLKRAVVRRASGDGMRVQTFHPDFPPEFNPEENLGRWLPNS
jgi:hypothetical protein